MGFDTPPLTGLVAMFARLSPSLEVRARQVCASGAEASSFILVSNFKILPNLFNHDNRVQELKKNIKLDKTKGFIENNNKNNLKKRTT